MDKFNWTDQELLAYEQGRKRLRDEIAAFAQKFDEGIKVGREEGIKIGKEHGREEGRKVEKIEIAKSMLADNLDIDAVAKFTGLPVSEIKELQKENTH